MVNGFQRIKRKLLRNRLVLLRQFNFVSAEVYVKYLYHYYTGKTLDLSDPKEFNEKIQWYKVRYHPKILNQLVDKYDVRSFVADRIGEQYLNDMYGVYNTPEDIPFDELPNKYVIKTTNASSYNLIVSNNETLNKTKTRQKLKKWLKKASRYYLRSREWPYKDVAPRLIIEKFLKDKDQQSLVDYKFYCFNGEAKFVEIHIDRAKNHRRSFYDFNLNKLEFRYVPEEQSITRPIKKPDNFLEMKNLSEKLSQNFPFVRVDFYSINGKSIFGEMTFFPSGGRKDFIPEKYNRIIGNYFKLPQPPNGKQIITEIDKGL